MIKKRELHYTSNENSKYFVQHTQYIHKKFLASVRTSKNIFALAKIKSFFNQRQRRCK